MGSTDALDTGAAGPGAGILGAMDREELPPLVPGGLNAEDRVFLYLRMVADGQAIARTKVRELAGLPGALADLAGSMLRGEVDVPAGALPRIEYVDNDTEQVLIAMYVDEGDQVIEGQIPARARKRMLDEETRIDVDRFEERAARGLDHAQRAQLDQSLSRQRHDIRTLIREHIRDDGSFYIRVPL